MTLITPYWLIDFVLVLGSLYALLYKYFTRHFDHWKQRNVPFIKPQPFFGNFKDVCFFKTVTGEHLANLYSEMKDHRYFGIFMLDRPVLVLRDPELIKTVMVKDFNHFYDHTLDVKEDNQPLVANMLFFSRNPKWKVLRNNLTSVFSSSKLKGMVLLMNEVGENLKQYLKKHSDGAKCLEAKEICAKYSTDVTASCSLGIDAHSLDNEDAIMRKVGHKIFDFNFSNAIQQTCTFFAPQIANLFDMRFIGKEATDFLTDTLLNTIAERESSQHKRNDLIDIIIEMKKKPNFSDYFKSGGVRIAAQAAQFFVAGFETTSSTMAFVLYELCMNPKIQHAVRGEINLCIQKHGGCTYEALNDMKYLNQCISETLRKYPVIPFLDRLCVEDFHVPASDFIIEKGTAVSIPLFGLHYDPHYFPDPQKFDPDRFSENGATNIPAGAYLPFGDGPRNCIGGRFGILSTKVGIVSILSEYELLKGDETPSVIKFGSKSFVLASEVGIPLVFKRIISIAA